MFETTLDHPPRWRAYRFPALRATWRVGAALAGLLAACAAWSADGADGWKLEKDKDGIQIHSRPVEGWSIHEVRGLTRIPARLSSLVAVIHDVPATPELSDVVSEASLQHRDSDTRYRVYSVIKMPWPVKNRDMLNQREITQDPQTLAVVIRNVATQDIIPPKDGLIRIVRSRQEWILTPAGDGQVAVEMRMLTDPAGPIPAAVINAMSVGAPFKMIAKLREMAQRPSYAQAKLDFIKEP